MMHLFENIEGLKNALVSAKIERDIDSVLKLDLPFFDYDDKLSIIYFPLYGENIKILAAITKKDIFVCAPFNINNSFKKYRHLLKKTGGESTLIAFLTLRATLKNYSEQFLKIRDIMDSLETRPIIDKIEEVGLALRRLTDKIEGLVEIIIVLKQKDVKQFDIKIINFDYEILSTEARYWLERCRSHIYRIASLRTRSEMQSNKELNDTMGRLTVIITILTIVSIVVAIPGTIGAIFGIPALSDVYFRSHTNLLVAVLVIATSLSIILGFAYWRSLGLKYKNDNSKNL